MKDLYLVHLIPGVDINDPKDPPIFVTSTRCIPVASSLAMPPKASMTCHKAFRWGCKCRATQPLHELSSDLPTDKHSLAWLNTSHVTSVWDHVCNPYFPLIFYGMIFVKKNGKKVVQISIVFFSILRISQLVFITSASPGSTFPVVLLTETYGACSSSGGGGLRNWGLDMLNFS